MIHSITIALLALTVRSFRIDNAMYIIYPADLKEVYAN